MWVYRHREGELLGTGLNWQRDARTRLMLVLFARLFDYYWSIGFRWSHTGRLYTRCGRQCALCDWRTDYTCARHQVA